MAVEVRVEERMRRNGGIRRLSSAAVLSLGALGLLGASSAAAQEDPTPHSDAELISEVSAVRPGEPFTIGLHITLDEGWHTYWINAGDAGNGVLMDWTLPEGFTVDSLRYPAPERIPYPPLMSYGYHDQVVLLATVSPPAELVAGSVELAAVADFLVCADVCIPARADLDLTLPVRSSAAVAASASAPLIREFRGQLPIEGEGWSARAARTDQGFVIALEPPQGWAGAFNGAYFFPADPTTLSHTAEQTAGLAGEELRLQLTQSDYLPAEPEVLEGILVLPEGQSFDDDGHRALELSVPVETGAVAWTEADVTPLAAPAVQSSGPASAGGGGLTLLVALLFALVGGVILNLMPCVFPILSLKALGFASRGGDRSAMRADGLAFGAGVVVTFLVVAAALLAVRAGGAQVGWGYQLQSPTVVALLAALMFGIGLWLAGVVELGASLTRVGGIGGAGEGTGSAFLTGVLATIVATPCTAPFMGAAIGAALIRPPVEALTIFAALGVGMAAPYVALSFWPALARKLPRPGRWMETFKQVLAFPMFAVAVWLVWVFGLQTGMGGAARLMFALLLLSLAAWLVGRWPATLASGRIRVVTRSLALLGLVTAVMVAAAAVRGAEPLPSGGGGGDEAALEWEEFSPELVAEYRSQGRPVFVDFTAAWCISCQVNERVALHTEEVAAALRDYDVALVKADWTRRDPVITEALASFDRAGVPLYVLYPPDPSAGPRLLPELLTKKIVLDALRDTLGEPPERKQARQQAAAGG